MSDEPATPQRIWELVYGLLPEEESAELRAAIAADRELAAAHARAQAAASLLGQAARWPGPPIALRRPETVVAVPFVRAPLAGEPPRPKPPLVRAGPEVRRPWARWAGWTVGIAASVLLLLALGGYWYHRTQLGDMAAGPVRVLLAGPPWLEAGHAPRFSLLTTSLAGQPVSAHVELGFWSPDGQHLGGHKERTDAQGRLEVSLPADSRILQAPEVRVTLQAFREKHRPGPPLEARLPVRPEETAIHLALEKAVFRPGETVRFRSLALHRWRLTPSPAARLHYEVQNASGTVLGGSRGQCTLSQGLAWGEYRLPPTLPEGQYTLVAGIPGTPSQGRRTFSVKAGPVKPAAGAAAGGAGKKLCAAFVPEGGALVAGSQNRVYFAVRNAEGQPLRMTGRIVDGQNRPVALVETGEHGLGAFSFEPAAEQSYRLVVETPEGVEDSPPLPPVVVNSDIVLSTGRGVFEADKPLEFVVRCKEAGVPLVAAAWCRGVAVGQHAFVTQTQASAGPTQANPVILPVDESAAGVLRLCIFDYRNSPPRLVAERLVFRQPGRHLHLQVAASGPAEANGAGPGGAGSTQQAAKGSESALPPSPLRSPSQFAVRVTDEEGRPAAATLAAWMASADPPEPPADGGESLLASVLLGPDLLEAGILRHLGPIPSVWAEPEKTLDLVLGTYGVSGEAGARTRARSATGQAPKSDSSAPANPDRAAMAASVAPYPAGWPAPSLLLDNLGQLKTEYQDRLESYRKHRTRVLNTVITLIFFGGVGLVLFVGMANLLNIPCGVRLWAPTLVTAGICLAVGLELLHPERHVGPGQAVAFVPYQHSVSAAKTGAAGGPALASSGQGGTERRTPAVAVSPTALTAPGRQSPGVAPSLLAGGYWNPAIPTDQEGKAVLDVGSQGEGARRRLMLEAYAPTGRLGAFVLELPGVQGARGAAHVP
mgnify:CR=1 FL=1